MSGILSDIWQFPVKASLAFIKCILHWEITVYFHLHYFTGQTKNNCNNNNNNNDNDNNIDT